MTRGFGIPATQDAGRAVAVSRECERLGYRTVWTNDTPGADGICTARDMLEATKSLRIGIGVVACDRRPAGEVAQLIRSLVLPLNRLVLGIGAGSSRQPLKTIREAVGTFRNTFGSEIKLGVAAMGPQMCRLAGELADLVLFNWMVPERIVWAEAKVSEGESERNQTGTVERAAYIRVALGAQAGALIASEASRYNQFPAYARHFAAMATPLDLVGVAQDRTRIHEDLAAYDRLLDETVVRALPALDTIESTLAVGRAAAPNGVH